MTTPPSTPDTTPLDDGFPSADDAAAHQDFVQVLHRQLRAARHTADALQALGDQWHDEQISLPLVARHGDFTDVFEPGCPVDAGARTSLLETLKSAGRQAYVIAGHYRRVIPALSAALDHELYDAEPAYAVLAYAALDRLSYARSHDEWRVDGKPDPALHRTANRLQQAGFISVAGYGS